MGHNISSLGILSVLVIFTPGSAWAMSAAKTPNSPDAPAATAIPLTSDGHHYRAILFGGSCEEGNAVNGFHSGFIQDATQLNASGWDVRPSFAGDSAHCAGTAADPCPPGVSVADWSSDSIAQAAGKDPSTVGRASKADLLASLDQAVTDLASGDELLVVIDTHGFGEQVTGQSYWAHGICVSSDQPHGTVANIDPSTGKMNAANKEGRMYMTDPDLVQRLQKLRTAGVKMAFLDDSCYGGGSIPALSAYGCTMTSATSHQENFETGSIGSTEAQSSENGIAFNLPDLLMADSDSLTAESLHSGEVTMEEFWLRILARSKIAGVPEFSGFLADAQQAENLEDWFINLDGDVTYRRGNTPFTSSPGPNVYTAEPLTAYAQTYLDPLADPAAQATDAHLVSSNWASPGMIGSFDNITSKTVPALQTQLSQFQGQWNTWVSQFNALTAQEKPLLDDLASLNMTVTWSFTGALAGTEDLLNTVLPTVQGQAAFAFPTSTNGNPWIVLENNFDTPVDPEFAGDGGIAVDSVAYFMNAYKLSHDSYISGLSDSYSGVLTTMILQAEKDAWNAATPAAQNQMKNDFQRLQSLRDQERTFLNELPVDTLAYLAQARMYSYLNYRKQAALIDPNLSQCGDFVLKRY
jgi:hypothetical protein